MTKGFTRPVPASDRRGVRTRDESKRGGTGRFDTGTRPERRRQPRDGEAISDHPERRSTLFGSGPEDQAPRGRRGRPLAPLGPRPRRSLTTVVVSFCAKSVVMVMLAWALCFNFSEVRGGSMLPGIQDRDRILVDHVSYLFTQPARGDVVVLRYPMDPTLDYVKRVVGLPGDHVEISDGLVWVNGTQMDEPYLDPLKNDPYAYVDTIVQADSYFVLGDNRIRSSDSREFGQVPHEYLRGKVRARLWPIARVGAIH